MTNVCIEHSRRIYILQILLSPNYIKEPWLLDFPISNKNIVDCRCWKYFVCRHNIEGNRLICQGNNSKKKKFFDEFLFSVAKLTDEENLWSMHCLSLISCPCYPHTALCLRGAWLITEWRRRLQHYTLCWSLSSFSDSSLSSQTQSTHPWSLPSIIKTLNIFLNIFM